VVKWDAYGFRDGRDTTVRVTEWWWRGTSLWRWLGTRPIRLSYHMKLKRISCAAALGAACLAAPHALDAQQQVGKVSRVGVLMNLYAPDAPPPQSLRQRLRDLGYVDGENLVINVKTAKALGLTLSPSMLSRVDEVVQ
jgi:hypothetical protein